MTKPSASELIACFQDTLQFSQEGELAQETRAAASGSRVYPEKTISARLHTLWDTEIRVEENTTLAAARRYAHTGRVAVLNFANPHYPGGNVAGGSATQEECLCRSSNLYPCLDQEPMQTDYYRYHREKTDYFFSDRLIYSRDVTVFKDDSLLPQYLPREEWFQVDVITCAAPFLAKRRYTNQTVLQQIFISRIRNILEAAIDNGADILILGAFGCGVFRNPPEIVAGAFRMVLSEERYRRAFRKVIFAIRHSEKNISCPNLDAFSLVFGIRTAEKTPGEEILPAIILPGGRTLETSAQIRQFKQWQKENPYFGKQFAILGDSCSTLEGFNPRGYQVYYQNQTCEETRVRDMPDTWWGKVIGFFGGELLTNDSWSGSTVAVKTEQKNVFPSGCSRHRTGSLNIGDVRPEVILVNMGISDWVHGLPVEGDTLHAFKTAYARMLTALHDHYPEAEVWCLNLGQTNMNAKPSFRFPADYGGIDIRLYNQSIKECAEEFECKLLDVSAQQKPYDTLDGLHPTAEGMDTLACAVLLASEIPGIRELLSAEEASETASPMNMDSIPDEMNALHLWLTGEDRLVRLEGPLHLVGRSTDCDLQLTSPYAARYQATFLREGNCWFLRDNNSRNGTFVNGIRLKPGESVMLRQGDSISFARKEEAKVM